MTVHDIAPLTLDAPLPESMRPGRQTFVTRYKNYPVFSWPWWWRRTVFFSPVALALFFVPTFWMWRELSNTLAALQSAAFTTGAFAILVTLGPGIASAIRYRRLPAKWEGIAIVAVILACIGVASVMEDVFNAFRISILDEFPAAKQQLLALAAEKQARNQNSPVLGAITGYLVAGSCGGLLAIPAYFRESWSWRVYQHERIESALRAQKHEASLKLSLLQAQVEPHFLFNTLASVRMLIRQDPAQSEATLDALVAYLRGSIPQFRDGEARTASLLGHQLDLCASYLEVMRIRTAGRLQHAVEVDASLRDAAFPPMLLITLVENAIKHGIEPKPGPGRVTISATRDGDALHVVVDDDGVGLQPGVGGGLGLANVRAQLDALYGKRATFDLRSRGTGGVRAELRLPMAQAA